MITDRKNRLEEKPVNSPALSKARVAVSALMASGTLATAWLATSLAIASHDASESVAAPDTSVSVGQSSHESSEASHSSAKKRTSSSSTGFAPAKQAQPASGTTHTKTKGS